MYLGSDPSAGEFGVGPRAFSGGPIHAALFTRGWHVLAIQVDDAVGGRRFEDGKAWRDAADAVIASFHFTGAN